MWKEYLNYLKDNPNRYWFKRKLYGFGWVPATWEGFLTIVVFIMLIIINFRRIDGNSHSVSDTLLNFIPETALFVFLLIFICYKTGEKPRFQWGVEENHKK